MEITCSIFNKVGICKWPGLHEEHKRMQAPQFWKGKTKACTILQVTSDANINKIQTQNARYYLFTNIKSIILLQFNIEMSQIMYIEVINITFD